jgi:ribosomal protein L37E
MSHYQVLFSGEIAKGAQENAVRENLSRELGIDERKAAQLFSGRTVVIRSHLTQEDAQYVQARFAELGAVCRIKDLTPKLEEQKLDYRVDRQDREADHTLRDITAAHVECPRCGHLQLEASHCARCGIDIAAAIKAQRKEDLIIEKRIRELKGRRGDAEPNNITPMSDRRVRYESRDRDDERFESQRSDKKAGRIKGWFKKSS